MGAGLVLTRCPEQYMTGAAGVVRPEPGWIMCDDAGDIRSQTSPIPRPALRVRPYSLLPLFSRDGNPGRPYEAAQAGGGQGVEKTRTERGEPPKAPARPEDEEKGPGPTRGHEQRGAVGPWTSVLR
ncbi:hypothetical protein GCM10020229_22780 [Kitasatospora albolonga]